MSLRNLFKSKSFFTDVSVTCWEIHNMILIHDTSQKWKKPAPEKKTCADVTKRLRTVTRQKKLKPEITSALSSSQKHLSSIPVGCRNGCWTRWTRRRRGRRRGCLTKWWHAEALNGTRARIIAGRRSLQVQCVTPVRTSAKTKHATLRPVIICRTGWCNCGVGHTESCRGRLACCTFRDDMAWRARPGHYQIVVRHTP